MTANARQIRASMSCRPPPPRSSAGGAVMLCVSGSVIRGVDAQKMSCHAGWLQSSRPKSATQPILGEAAEPGNTGFDDWGKRPTHAGTSPAARLCQTSTMFSQRVPTMFSHPNPSIKSWSRIPYFNRRYRRRGRPETPFGEFRPGRTASSAFCPLSVSPTVCVYG